MFMIGMQGNYKVLQIAKEFDEEEHDDNNKALSMCILIIYNGNYMFMVGSLVDERGFKYLEHVSYRKDLS